MDADSGPKPELGHDHDPDYMISRTMLSEFIHACRIHLWTWRVLHRRLRRLSQRLACPNARLRHNNMVLVDDGNASTAQCGVSSINDCGGRPWEGLCQLHYALPNLQRCTLSVAGLEQ